MKKALFLLVFAFLASQNGAAQTAIGPVLNFSATPFEASGPVETLYKKSFSGGAVLQFSRKRHRFLTGISLDFRKADWGRTQQWSNQFDPTTGEFDPNRKGESVRLIELGPSTNTDYRFILAQKRRVLPLLAVGLSVGTVWEKMNSSPFSNPEFQFALQMGFGTEIPTRQGVFFFVAGVRKMRGFEQLTASLRVASGNWDTAISPYLEAGWLFDLRGSEI